MKARDVAMTTAGLVAVAAWVAASVTAWLLATAPTTVALAIQGDGEPVAQVALHALDDLLASLVRYL